MLYIYRARQIHYTIILNLLLRAFIFLLINIVRVSRGYAMYKIIHTYNQIIAIPRVY